MWVSFSAMCQTDSIELPNGRLTGAEIPATGWLVYGNTSTNNVTVKAIW